MAVNGTKVKAAPKLGTRGEHVLSTATLFPSRSFLADAYHPTLKPDGYINLNAAQNMLQQEELLAFLKPRFDLSEVDFFFGDDLSGSRRLLTALSGFVNKNFSPLSPVKEEHIVLGAGCAAVTEQMLHFLADPGDGVLVPQPHFGGYTADLTARNGLKRVLVPTTLDNHFSLASVPLYEETLKKAEAEGIPIRAMIICNPENPLGRYYPRETILAYAKFCEAHNIHLICDEIFAFSTFKSEDLPEEDAPPFVSTPSIDFEKEANCNPARVHTLYGLSKDFNANGLRGGAVISPHNPGLLVAIRSTSGYMKISSATSVLWSLILEDHEFWAAFVAENQKRLAEAYKLVTAWLKFQHIPYFPAYAGHFVSVNLRQFFPASDAEGNPISDPDEAAKDQALGKLLLENRIMLGASTSFAFPERGWVRMCYSYEAQRMLVAFKRMEKAFGLPAWGGFESHV